MNHRRRIRSAVRAAGRHLSREGHRTVENSGDPIKDLAGEVAPMSSEYTMLSFDEAEPEPSALSGTPRVTLTDALGCEQLRANVWYLAPGDAMSYHRHREQDELYVQLHGPGRMRIGDDELDVPERTAVRVPVETPRQVFNDTDEEHTWLVVGAPPVENDSVTVE